MALFGTKKKDEKDVKVAEKATVATAEKTTALPRNIDNILIQPRITEKASFRTGGNVYTFEVATRATKRDVAHAIKAFYKVTPQKVNIAKIPSKKKFSRGKMGMKKGGKKAYVYLKKGDSIDLI